MHLEKSDKEIRKLCEERDKMRKKTQEDLKKHNEKVEHLGTVIKRLEKEENESIQKLKEETMLKNESLSRENERLKKKVKDIADENEKRGAVAENLKKENEVYKTGNTKMKEANEKSQQEISVVNKQQDVFDKKFKSLSKDFKNNLIEKQTLLKKLKRSEAESKDLKKLVKGVELKSEAVELQKKLEETDKSLELVTKENDILKQQLSKTANKMKYNDLRIKAVIKQLI